MATKQGTIDYLFEQIEGVGNTRYRKMFGEYAVYFDEKVVALVCDDKLYLKPTAEGKKLIENVEEGIPYPGAKPYLYISADLWEDRDWLCELIITTARQLPRAKPRRK